MSNDPNDYRLPPFPKDYQGLSRDWLDYGHACADAARAPLIRDLAECFNLGGSDADGNGDDWRAANAVRSVRQLRADYDESCDEGEKLRARIAELESLLSGVVSDTAEELGCAPDNEAILLAANRLRAEVEALRAVLVRARRGLAWASQQRPELIEDYEAVDTAIAARKGVGVAGA